MSKRRYIIGYMAFVWIFGLCSAAYAEDLHFNPAITRIDLSIKKLDYKQIRSREICKMAKDKGFSEDDCPIIVSHLYIENGAMAERRHGDHGCSIGMIQWNVCVHTKYRSAEALIKAKPEWADWRYQVNFYLDKIKSMMAKYGSLESAIAEWNPGAKPYYLKKVKSNVSFANTLLN